MCPQSPGGRLAELSQVAPGRRCVALQDQTGRLEEELSRFFPDICRLGG